MLKIDTKLTFITGISLMVLNNPSAYSFSGYDQCRDILLDGIRERFLL